MRQINRYMERAVLAADEGAKAAQAHFEAERLKERQGVWDANWRALGRVPGIVRPGVTHPTGGPKLGPGEKIVAPES